MKNSRVGVKVKNGDLGKALKLFKKKVEISGHLNELRERRYFVKPSTLKRLQKQDAIYRENKNRIVGE
jgi:small subunit ribosomal protein S21